MVGVIEPQDVAAGHIRRGHVRGGERVDVDPVGPDLEPVRDRGDAGIGRVVERAAR